MSDLMIGADPELFVRKGNKYVSGHTFDLGSKEQPKTTKHGSVQRDGLALEFNVMPSSDSKEFVRNVKDVLADLNALVKKEDQQCRLEATPTVHFGSDYIASLPLWVQNLGCNPDFSAYTGEPNEKPDAGMPFRTGAGHVHLGWTGWNESYEHFLRCIEIVWELDFYLGLPSLEWDNDDDRRLLYGKAGAFRPKPYGCEYRVLSNAWVNSDKLMAKVFKQSKKAYLSWLSGDTLYKKYGLFAKEMLNNSERNWKAKAPEGLVRVIEAP